MPTEELGVKVSVEGFADFEAAFKKMAQQIDGIEQAYEELGGQSKQTGTALDGLGQAYDGNAARLNKLRLAMTQLDDVQAKLKTETNALARAQLEVKADALKKQIEDLSKVESDASQNTQKFKLSLTDLKSGIDMAVGAFKTVAAAAKEAFEFLQEGAAINATKESFDRLGISIDAMRTASNNTIPDIKLMSSTLTLMAGTSGEVADAFGDAMPQLLAMAKAANKLNPTMGDTTYMLESITTAAKRQSMQIADNLGIIVKQGDAYKKYADSIGVAVGALTNEQKQVAFLNGLLEAGNVLIEQAGGATESAADGYAVLTTTIKNLTDEMKASAAEGVGPLAQRFADFMQAAQATDANLYSLGGNLQFLKALLTGTSDVQEKYNADLQATADAAERARLYGEAWERQIANNTTATTTETTALNDSKTAFDMYSAATQTSEQALSDYYAAQQAANESAVAAQIAFNNAAAALDEMTRAAFAKAQIDALKQSLDEGKISSEDFATAQEAILVQFGLLTPAEKSAQGSIETLRQAFLDGKISAETFALAVAQVKTGLDGLDGRTVTVNFDYRIPAMPSLPSGGQPSREQAYQHGGTLGSGAFVVGERGPELITGWRGGGNVLSNPTAARMLAQNSVTNNYNLTTNSTTRAGGLALEFATMEMGSR